VRISRQNFPGGEDHGVTMFVRTIYAGLQGTVLDAVTRVKVPDEARVKLLSAVFLDPAQKAEFRPNPNIPPSLKPS